MSCRVYQVEYYPIQEFHYLPKTLIQLLCQYLVNSDKRRQQLQPWLHAQQQHLLWQQARAFNTLECCICIVLYANNVG